ncbi:polyamine ABC transporter substrate-binding protein [Rhodospirillaceae bacterium KN72]|uniref:Polyamine ABC transporter substrate-binding protein n=1 Tax=Pacificispira spongiicola TaxID=2729598 RepID=A0A7Y0E2L8_9PROT|nr:ABC transporter substrate-binding protein [Pacificispira spongiicola]NMM46092.1 polyamine ABC transporter substrate-binding protein [Pacificispira spongiicola]
MVLETVKKVATAAVVAAFSVGVFAGGVQAADPDLVVFDWSGYEDPNFYLGYNEKHGDAPTFSFFGDEEEAFQKLRAGFKADLAHPCAQSIVRWKDAGLLAPMDATKINGYDNLIPGLRDMPGFHDGNTVWFLPIDWGNTALTYRADTVPVEDVQSLQVFADPKYEGKISIGDNVDDAYALAFLAIGVTDWTTATDEQFQAASEFLRKVHQNVRLYWQDGATLAQSMVSGEVQIAWAWNETFVQMQAEGHNVLMKRDTDEGLSSWVCGYTHIASGEGKEDKMYDFINAWLEDRTADYIVNAWGYGHSSQTGLNKVDPAVLAGAGYDNVEAFMDKTLWQAPVPAQLREKMIAEFEQIKAGF